MPSRTDEVSPSKHLNKPFGLMLLNVLVNRTHWLKVAIAVVKRTARLVQHTYQVQKVCSLMPTEVVEAMVATVYPSMEPAVKVLEQTSVDNVIALVVVCIVSVKASMLKVASFNEVEDEVLSSSFNVNYVDLDNTSSVCTKPSLNIVIVNVTVLLITLAYENVSTPAH